MSEKSAYKYTGDSRPVPASGASESAPRLFSSSPDSPSIYELVFTILSVQLSCRRPSNEKAPEFPSRGRVMPVLLSIYERPDPDQAAAGRTSPSSRNNRGFPRHCSQGQERTSG